MNTVEMQAEALHRATTGQSTSNYPAIFAGFEAKGIDPADIDPRVNVLTYRAWQALGRQVRKGEHGVKLHTWVNAKKEISSNGTTREEDYRLCRTVTVFHISQTEPASETNH